MLQRNADRMRSWTDQNTDWQHTVLTDEDGALFNENTFREDLPELVNLYHAFPHPVAHSDVLRYTHLWRHGGVWADVDTTA